jgi:nicotinamidase-related amidase
MAVTASDLKFGGLNESCAHLCIDMQRMFSEPTPWQVDWLPRILPQCCQITALHPERTFFTRFITAKEAGMGHGAWKRYYQHWESMTIEKIGAEMLDLVPDLRPFVPPAQVIDKHIYSPWIETDLHRRLQQGRINTLVITGGETEVCVLATVMGAIDLGYRVIVVKDALCSSVDETHDKMVDLYCARFQMQIEAVDTEVILQSWKIG